MTYRRGLRRLAFLVTILYWGFVAWWIFAPVAGPWGDDAPALVPEDFALSTLLVAGLIYFFIMGLFWTLFGFYGERPYDERGRRLRYED